LLFFRQVKELLGEGSDFFSFSGIYGRGKEDEIHPNSKPKDKKSKDRNQNFFCCCHEKKGLES
jgi:hypothetical protein